MIWIRLPRILMILCLISNHCYGGLLEDVWGISQKYELVAKKFNETDHRVINVYHGKWDEQCCLKSVEIETQNVKAVIRFTLVRKNGQVEPVEFDVKHLSFVRVESIKVKIYDMLTLWFDSSEDGSLFYRNLSEIEYLHFELRNLYATRVFSNYYIAHDLSSLCLMNISQMIYQTFTMRKNADLARKTLDSHLEETKSDSFLHLFPMKYKLFSQSKYFDEVKAEQESLRCLELLMDDNLKHLDLFEMVNILKYIAMNYLHKQEILEAFIKSLSVENNYLTSYLIKNSVLQGDRLVKQYRGKELALGEFLDFLRTENDILFLALNRYSLSQAMEKDSMTEAEKVWFDHGIEVVERQAMRSKLRIYFCMKRFQSLNPEHFDEVVGSMLNEKSSIKNNFDGVDFDTYGRYSQAGSAITNFLNIEKKIKSNMEKLSYEEFQEILKDMYKSFNTARYLPDVLKSIKMIPKSKSLLKMLMDFEQKSSH